MPWTTPTLRDVRSFVRDAIHSSLPGSDATPPNSVLRVMSDAQGALCHLTLQYIDWLSLQLMPDTAEAEWLDRFGNIWLVNSDGTTGRKQPTSAAGTVNVTGSITNTVLPIYSQLTGANPNSITSITYQTTEQIVVNVNFPTPVAVRAIDPGSAGNLLTGAPMVLTSPPYGINGSATVVEMDGGTDTETDDELRARILKRIREPPMGGDATDYEQWALAVPGVTRAWCFPQEMGIGTCTLRFMMDELRASNGGFPLPDDVDTVAAYINSVRPVTVKDMFVECPIPFPVNLKINYLDVDNAATHAAIIASLQNEFFVRSMPGQIWYRAWTDEAIMNAPGVNAYDLTASDVPMPSSGYMPILGDVTYG